MVVKLEKILETEGAVGSFNVVDLDMALAIIEGAEELKVPVIIGIATRHWKAARGHLLAPSILKAIEKASVPSVLHLDHSGPKEEHIVREALDCGFTSIMIDGSKLPFAENAAVTRNIVTLAKSYGASVEGEIGAITGVEGVVDGEHKSSESLFTDPDEAEKFVIETGVNALAVSIGTAHGLYKAEPVIQFDLISALKKKVHVPLVMHGATGLSDEVMRKTIRCGIRKINYFSGLVVEAVEGTGRYLETAEKPDYVAMRKTLFDGWKKLASDQMKIYSLK
ncbi:MAG: class II fructose-bisphosphate aldolase [Spirochaetia bacterium]|jgi:ketose-bisphosphate aldolase|nr:class II fructose-bisphosphate aldolase [Spirochaetia bacterium]